MIPPSDILGPVTRPLLEGLTSAVYGLVLPETRAMLQRLWSEQPHVLFERAYEDTQDAAHLAFLRAWRHWVAPCVTGLDAHEFQYVTNGSSEGIRESVWHLAKTAHDAGTTPQLHVFAGEYEGYGAYARAAGVEVVVHDRAAWRDIEFAVGTRHRWYVSQPSAVDGNVWPDFAEFLRTLDTRGVEAAVDLAYVGAVPNLTPMDLALPNVSHVFFSLSKVFGVFYHRVGGVLSRSAMLGLEGNKWFKNTFSLYLGTSLMEETPTPTTLPSRYRSVQTDACRIVAERHGIPLEASDVILLASAAPGPYPDAFRRGPRYRFCLTPAMDRLLSGGAAHA